MCDLEEAGHLIRLGDIRLVDAPPIWATSSGRDLHSVPLAPGQWKRIVACLNIWNDLNALRLTLPTWYDHVDAVIAVDGAYPTTGAEQCASTDGTVEFLRDQSKVTLLEAPDGGWWMDQNAKRSAYLQALQPGDLAFVIDADEHVSGAEQLRRLPAFDVGWVRINSPLYARGYGQPRLFKSDPSLRYEGRHHWIYRGAELLTTHQYGGVGVEHAVTPISLRNARGLGHSDERRKAKRTHIMTQSVRESVVTTGGIGSVSDQRDSARESLRICQVTLYDAGLAVSRLHSALNATTPHTSLMFRDNDGGPFGALTQFERQAEQQMNEAVKDADVLHCHLSLNRAVRNEQLITARRLVLHHHGSMYRGAPEYHRSLAEHYRALVLVSTLELLQYARAEWLPNPVPVARYRRLRDSLYRPGKTFRVAHSPSKRELKGTEAFLAACDTLNAKGVAVEPVLIEGTQHGEGLALKASCDAAFDSFWLGIQCSGLEAAAMGMPVIAGDDHVAAEYRRIVGTVPYTFANDVNQLAEAIGALATDRSFYDRERERVGLYCLQYHDEAAVAVRYLDLLDDAFDWRNALALEPERKPRTTVKPEPRHPMPAPIIAPQPAPMTPTPREPQTRAS